MLPFYAKRFPTVEAHSTYRRLPTATALERWASQVPPEFRFAPKAHMGITHRRDLDGIEERMAVFFEALTPLESLLGPVLFCIPHQQPDADRLDRLLGALPPLPRLARDLPRQRRRDSGHRRHRRGERERNADQHGRRRSRYDRAALDDWAQRLEGVSAAGRDAYAFFKHDETGSGPRYARQVNGRLSRR